MRRCEPAEGNGVGAPCLSLCGWPIVARNRSRALLFGNVDRTPAILVEAEPSAAGDDSQFDTA